MGLEILISLADELRSLVRPIEKALASEATFAALLQQRGQVVDPATLQIATIRSAFDISDDIIAIAEDAVAIASAEDSPPPAAVSDLIDKLISLIGKLRDLTTRPAPPGLSAAAWAALADQLLQVLVAEYLQSTYPVLYASFLAVGVIEEEEISSGGAAGSVDYVRQSVVWSRLPRIFSDTSALFDELYGWSTPAAFHFDRATRVVARALELFGFVANAALPDPALLNLYFSSANPARPLVRNLRITLLDTQDESGNALKFVLSLFPVPAGGPDAAPNALLINLIPTAVGALPSFAPPPFDLEFTGDVLTQGLQLQLSPNGITIPNVPGGASALNAGIKLTTATPTIQLIGSRFSSHLEVDAWSAALRIKGSRTDLEFEIELGWESARFVIDEGDGDGFLQKILPIKSGAIELSLSVIWSSKTGLRLGGAGVEITIAINKTFGPLELQTVTIGIATNGEGLTVSAGVTIGLKIGPLAATVDRIGLAVKTKPIPAGNPPGLLGNLDFAFGFKPPSGAGLSVSAGPVTGGGYLFFDPDNEQYAGILQLSFKTIGVTAIGLLTTRLPDPAGPPGATIKGFSLLLIITFDLPPIQLGYGFTLNGVGGLLGINRTMMVDVLRDGVRNHTVDAILFPHDPIARAAEIISTLRSIFPPAEGRFVFGPMVKIGWGPNAIIEFEAALVLELMAPIRLVVLGRIQIALPDKKDPVLNLRLDIVGVIDFDRGEVSVDASLVDSRIAVFTISGDMALRVGWGASKIFLIAAGGFNPRFQPPAGFPSLGRLAIALADSDNPRVRLESYIAITSNTIQMGALLDVYVKMDTFAGTFSLAVLMGFDAMIQFEPFALIAELSASVDILRNDVPLLHAALKLTFTGPGPWHLVGYAEFDFLGKHRIDVDATLGQPIPEPPLTVLPSVLADQLVEAFSREDAWAALPPPDSDQVVTLRAQPTNIRVRIHPLGALSARQRVLPLGKIIERFGAAEVVATTFVLNGFTFDLTQAAAAPAAFLLDDFAPGQFSVLTDDERLARPAFESMQSGGSLAVTAFRLPADAATGVSVPIGYEEFIVDDEPINGARVTLSKTSAAAAIPPAHLAAVAQAGAAGRSPTRVGGAGEFRNSRRVSVTVRGERFTAADANTLVADPLSQGGTSAAEAHDVRAANQKRYPARAQEVSLAHESS